MVPAVMGFLDSFVGDLESLASNYSLKKPSLMRKNSLKKTT